MTMTLAGEKPKQKMPRYRLRNTLGILALAWFFALIVVLWIGEIIVLLQSTTWHVNYVVGAWMIISGIASVFIIPMGMSGEFDNK